MGEELKFQKLSEVELVEEASESAHPLVEEDGKIKRAKGGLGGGTYIVDTSEIFAKFISAMNSGSDLPEGMQHEGNFIICAMPLDTAIKMVSDIAKEGSVTLKFDAEKFINTFNDYSDTSSGVGIFQEARGIYTVRPEIAVACTTFENSNDEVTEMHAAACYSSTVSLINESEMPCFMLMCDSNDEVATMAIDLTVFEMFLFL